MEKPDYEATKKGLIETTKWLQEGQTKAIQDMYSLRLQIALEGLNKIDEEN